MENETFATIVVTIIGLLFFVGIGSILASFFFDHKIYKIKISKTNNKSTIIKTKLTDYSDLLDDNDELENANVILDSKDTFDLNIQDIE